MRKIDGKIIDINQYRIIITNEFDASENKRLSSV